MDELALPNTRRIPVQERSRQRLERVLRVGEELIVERGFANLNMRELADIAKVNIATIYTYFPNSQALLRALAVRLISELEATVGAAYKKMEGFGSAEKMVDGLMDSAIAFYQRHPSFIAIWRGMQSDTELLAMDIDDTRFVAKALAPLLIKINPSFEANTEMAAMLILVIQGAVIRLASNLNVKEREAAYHQLRQFIRRMLIP